VDRLVLFVIRRIAVHGLGDAHAANAMMGQFGLSYHEPLMLLRSFLSELARVSLRIVTVAPCCSPRMTQDEARLLSLLANANADPSWARYHLEQLTGGAGALSPLSAAMAFSDTLHELGHALRPPALPAHHSSRT
jgi:hypothetical protein